MQNSPRSLKICVVLITFLLFFATLFVVSTKLSKTPAENKLTESNKEMSTISELGYHKNIPYKFENSPFQSAYYNVLDYFVFESVGALKGLNAWVKINDDISFKTNERLQSGEVVISGELGLSVTQKTGICYRHCYLKKIVIITATPEESREWTRRHNEAVKKYRKENSPGPILEKPQKVSPPRVN